MQCNNGKVSKCCLFASGHGRMSGSVALATVDYIVLGFSRKSWVKLAVFEFPRIVVCFTA